MSTREAFNKLCQSNGSTVGYHRDQSMAECPCLTPEGFRDPIWHLQHPEEPECNSAGMLSDPTTSVNISLKGFFQPIQSGAVRRLTSEDIIQMFGDVQADDHLAILPCTWAGTVLDFYEWGQAGDDWLVYNGRKFTVVSTNLIPDPSDGNPRHHWELGCRLVND